MKALVIGGTGPTGPYVVEGLLKKGYEVTILHRGIHESEFSQPVEHLHGDPHFVETLEQVLGSRKFDVVLSMYGRLRHVAQVMKGRTSRLIGIGGTPVYLGSIDPAHNPDGLLMPIPEDAPLITDPNLDKFSYLMVASEQEVIRAHQQGYYNATIFRYPTIYGPRQLVPREWSIVRRILDGRKHIILPDGGRTLRTRAYSENAAHTVMLAIEHHQSGGQIYNVGDEKVLTLREWIETISQVMGHEWEMVEMPWNLARLSTPYVHHIHHLVQDITKIKTELGYRDLVPAKEAIRRTVQWLLENRPEPGDEVEQQLKDPFCYEAEDQIIEEYKKACDSILQTPFSLEPKKHSYPHPKKPGERH